MLNAFIWMLKLKDFKKHFIYLTLTTIVSFLIAFYIQTTSLSALFQTILTLIFLAVPFLAITGYFWDTTQNVVDRSVDYKFSNIYGKGIKEKLVGIELPDFNLFKHIWRGISSLVASVLIMLPLYVLLTISGRLQELSSITTMTPTVMICLFYFSFFPALLWNYAKNNSIVSVFNFPKAVYIMGNYTTRYVIHTVILLALIFADKIINHVLCLHLTLDISTLTNIGSIISFLQNTDLLLLILPLIIILIKSIYLLMVYAYILGTIAPIDEF